MNRRRVIWGAAVVLGSILAFRLYQELGGGTDASAGPRGPGGPRAQTVEVVTPEFADITERVSLIGSLRAKQRVEVTPKFSGRVLEIRVDRGDAVRAGQVIARLEDDELRQQVRSAEASLEVARASQAQREAELKSVKVALDRYRDLRQDGVVSSQQLEQAQTGVEVSEAQANLAKAQVIQAEAQLQELRIRLGQTDILSPLTGVVAQRYVHPGALVSVNTPVVLVLDLAHLVTVINVPEREIDKVRLGNPARIIVDAIGGEEFEGQVVRISPLLDSQTRTAQVEIELPNPSGRLKAEMFARVDLNLTTERHALLIPRDALVYRSNRPGVFVVESEVVRFQSIETGLTEGDRIEALSGLSEKDTVVSRGANLLKNGDSVKVVHP
jgi:RND family efflux transporter MFP subunit